MSLALAAPLSLLLDVVEDPMLLVRSDGVIVGATPAMERRLAVATRTLIGSPLADLVSTPWEEVRVYLRRAGGTRQATIGTLSFRKADGQIFDSRCCGNLVQPAHTPDPGVSAADLPPPTPAIVMLRCQERSEALAPFLILKQRLDDLTREITRRREAERRLETLNQELELRVKQEVAAREQAQARLAQSQRLEALGQLAAGVAHDFNNVLQAISGGLALIQKRADNPDLILRLSRMAMSAAERGTAITGRLLSFARHGELRAEAVDTRTLLAALQEMLNPTLGSTISVTLRAAADVPPLFADRAQLETVLVNLVVNARDALPEGGTITLAADVEQVVTSDTRPDGLASGRYVRLTVTDTGLGMDADTLARAAEPFFSTKPVGKGTGLGLAMARGFAQQSGGGFDIDSRLGGGTTVTLWFPQAAPLADDSASSADADTATAPGRLALRVLLVDDDTLVREMLAYGLEDEGYQVVQAPDALTALAWLEKGDGLDLLITDFAMPGMSGLMLINEIRHRRGALPAILLTGYADTHVQRAVEETGHRHTVLLRKPVLSTELAEQAAVLLAEANAPFQY